MNAPRVLKLAEPAGLVLAATAASSGSQTATARSECVDALFKLLGSDAFRKDEEIALSVGESLATFAEAYRIEDAAAWATAGSQLPSDMDLAFALNSPPPVQVRKANVLCLLVSLVHN